MLLIECPWCGPREEVEFHCGGQAHLSRPERPGDLSDDDWGAYLFLRENPKGVFAERWVHSEGCRRWFNLLRHTVSHEILAVYRMGESPPEVEP